MNGAFVALAGNALFHWIVIVKDDGDRIVEIGNEPVLGRAVDEQVEALVEGGELLVALVEILQHRLVLGLISASARQVRRPPAACRIPPPSEAGTSARAIRN